MPHCKLPRLVLSLEFMDPFAVVSLLIIAGGNAIPVTYYSFISSVFFSLCHSRGVWYLTCSSGGASRFIILVHSSCMQNRKARALRLSLSSSTIWNKCYPSPTSCRQCVFLLSNKTKCWQSERMSYQQLIEWDPHATPYRACSVRPFKGRLGRLEPTRLRWTA